MIEKIPDSHHAVLGFRVVGDITADDYDVLRPAVQAAVDAHGSVRLLLDLTGFHREKIDAWGADLRFGQHFHQAIERLAIVGDHTWQRWLARLSEPFYAQESRFFVDQRSAWGWLEE